MTLIGVEEVLDKIQSFIILFIHVFLLLRAAPMASGGSQARGLSNWSYSCRPTPQPQQHGIRATSAIYTAAHGDALTHWARPGIEPTTSSFLVGFINHWATKGTPSSGGFFFNSVVFLFFKSSFLLYCFWLQPPLPTPQAQISAFNGDLFIQGNK